MSHGRAALPRTCGCNVERSTHTAWRLMSHFVVEPRIPKISYRSMDSLTVIRALGTRVRIVEAIISQCSMVAPSMAERSGCVVSLWCNHEKDQDKGQL